MTPRLNTFVRVTAAPVGILSDPLSYVFTSSVIDVGAYLVHGVDGVADGPVYVRPLVGVHAARGVVLDAGHKARPRLRK